jgi:menaquinol-cytochrome c reductase iron-sulfur subunit
MSEDKADPRRSFLKVVVGGTSAVISAVAAIPGLGFLAHPLRAKTVTGGDEPVRVSASAADLQPGKPLRVDIVSGRSDGWMRLDRVKLGAAWLVKSDEGEIRAFSTVCPHLGCGVEWDAKAERFDCPCHQSGFGTDGRCLFGPSPRGLDELEVTATDTELRVRYQRFKAATKSKEPLG